MATQRKNKKQTVKFYDEQAVNGTPTDNAILTTVLTEFSNIEASFDNE